MAEKKARQYISENAQLMAEWDWEMNNQLKINPYRIACGRKTNAWWR